jgi:cytochrome c oxidase cbb3-type subunit 3
MNEHQQELHDDHLLEHAYDGIQEYDNPLPRWWVALFWLTIVFTPLYILYYHFGPGPLAHDRYDAEMVAFYDKQAQELLAMGEITEATLVGLTGDQSMMNSGKKIFQGKCATCHGMFGEGGIGPNLTDRYWLHGGQYMDIYRTVREGVPTKGMLAWERQLRAAGSVVLRRQPARQPATQREATAGRPVRAATSERGSGRRHRGQ